MLKGSLIFLLKVMFGLIDLIFFSKKKDIIFHGYLGVPSGNNLALFNYRYEARCGLHQLYLFYW